MINLIHLFNFLGWQGVELVLVSLGLERIPDVPAERTGVRLNLIFTVV